MVWYRISSHTERLIDPKHLSYNVFFAIKILNSFSLSCDDVRFCFCWLASKVKQQFSSIMMNFNYHINIGREPDICIYTKIKQMISISCASRNSNQMWQPWRIYTIYWSTRNWRKLAKKMTTNKNLLDWTKLNNEPKLCA